MARPASFQQVDNVTAADDIARLSCADVLSQRANPLTLFTPALLVTHGGFDRDPVIEFDARFPADHADLRPFFIQLQRGDEAFFSGLGQAPVSGGRMINWDRRLYCIDASRAEDCFAFIGGIAFSNPKTGFFASVFSYDLAIPDPTSRRNQFLPVKIFGVAANSFVSLIEHRIGNRPRARQIKMTSADATMTFLRDRSLITNFDGTDPLNIRDET